MFPNGQQTGDNKGADYFGTNFGTLELTGRNLEFAPFSLQNRIYIIFFNLTFISFDVEALSLENPSRGWRDICRHERRVKADESP